MDLEMEKTGNQLCVSIKGSIDTITAPKLDQTLKEQLNDVVELILDFSGVDYISSAGLRVMLTMNQSMTDSNGKMMLKNVNDEVKEVFEMTGFDSILSFID